MNFKESLPIVCVQGLGFVGTVMAIAIATAKDEQSKACFNVVGVDLPSELGNFRINAINNGHLPFETSDQNLVASLIKCIDQGNLLATSENDFYKMAEIVVVDIPLDLDFSNPREKVDVNFKPFEKAIQVVGMNIKPGCLVLVETTVPPGTCEKVVKPIIEKCFEKRGLDKNKIFIAHSYERVMPGKDYLASITDFWRVFSGIDEKSGDFCESFLKKIINTEKYPMVRLGKTVASETAKILENSYRAGTIAFMEEWGRFAEHVGFDLFEVINAIRMRPTHSNMRQPGFGVGGYCLTKDPLFAKWSASNFYEKPELDFPFCTNTVETNKKMPFVTFDYVKKILGNLKGKKVALFGVSYRQDVGDTRYSPSEPFAKEVIKEGGLLTAFDPMVSYWEEMEMEVVQDLSSFKDFDLAVFTVPHGEFREIDFSQLPEGIKVIDANQVVTSKQIEQIGSLKLTFFSIGRGYL
jgi:UDP-N-acetyl-D-glucosamine dehydrogenase